MSLPFLPPAQEAEVPITLDDGKYLIETARKAIAFFLKEKKIHKPENPPKAVLQKKCVFVTLDEAGTKNLRGCIGYCHPVKELVLGAIECGISAAVGDPRFPPLTEADLGKIVITVSVLSGFEPVKADPRGDLPKLIKVGRDGLMIEHDIYSGLLLPQVPVDWKWNEEEFLSQTCDKAGLPKDCWKSMDIKVSRFTARVFQEEAPGGSVVEKTLTAR